MAAESLEADPLVITPINSPQQHQAARYLCTTTWGSAEQAERDRNRPVREREIHPLEEGRLGRLGWWGDQAVGHVGILRIGIRLGKVALMAAGVGGVCVHPSARKHGIASVLLKDALDASQRAGLSFSMLFGIANFYHRFGFVPALPDRRVLLQLALPKGRPNTTPWRARKARPADVPRMLKQHHLLYGRVDGMLAREPRIFLRRKDDTNTILHGKRKNDWAYVVCRKTKIDNVEQCEVIEAAGTGADWESAVLTYAANLASKTGKDRLSLCLPSQHPIHHQMMFADASDRVEHQSNAGAMVAVLDFAGLARDMAAEWSSRMAVTGAKVPRNGLLVRYGGAAYRWWPDHRDGRTERVEKVPRPVDVEFNYGLGRLVMGYGEPDLVMRHYGMRATEGALPAIRAIFAARQCFFSPVDHF